MVRHIVEEAELENGLGIVETRYFTFASPPNELILDCGERFGPITVAYETYGVLDEDRSNAILVLHAFSGDAHAAGWHEGESKPGWWDDMIGPGKAFDTDRYFVICSNVLGGCKGTTGPSSPNPATGKPYGIDFPPVTIPDMVRVQSRLLDYLGIDRLLTVTGGSMGGQQVLEWLVSYPRRVRSAIVIATAARHSPQQIAFNEVGRQAILADPDWQNGQYYGGEPPARGLSVARMVGHITYMSDKSMAEKFGRRTGGNGKAHPFGTGFEVEDYLHYKGLSFVDRFDANSYLYITRAIDDYDAARDGSLADAFRGLKARILVLSFKSDWLYPSYQSLEIVRACKIAGVDVTYCEINSTYGHDAFLLEVDEETTLVTHFLRKVFGGDRT
ncbi:MAG: homoserine O-acetyltransferase [Actinobacteria bacterium]|nr:homoserine O-acetyltransferase [Actinomycetota bacterium]MCG2820200.1 homoserine O-acetyltransferase [Actinomycetes bacterium]MBU4179209.1 homoserine O-acetyltransferase [Actinomycetota bacterium]MBU4219828.1 homoserine O-acetyltransferase [Actinomycetota bacterium]MBU4357722.1 homoserine O-acetyltransferase [Actinomycetota bacterium]